VAFSQADLNAISAAQAAHPNLGVSLLGVATQETGGSSDPDTAVSSTGAQGLFQVLPSTAVDPGFGVAPLVDANDPTASADFAANYIAGLEASGDTPAQAVTAYSGGGYTLAQVNAVSGSTTPATQDQLDDLMNTSGVADGGSGIAESQAIGGGINSAEAAAGGALTWIEELFDRAGIVIVGLLLLTVGLIFLFIDSRTIKTTVGNLGGKMTTAGAV
jgi:hypothetical protein